MANKMQFYAQMAEERSFGLQPGFINTPITNS